jgi:hypothetical protein
MNAATKITPAKPTSYQKLIALRDAINRALPVASLDEGKAPHLQNLFASREGLALVDAAHRLFECGQLYDLRADVAHELGIDDEEFPVGDIPLVDLVVGRARI